MSAPLHPAYGPGPGGPWPMGPMDPAHRQASSRYQARAKKPAMAWILWILGPFMLHAPIHDFYLGAIGRGLLKLALTGLAWLSFLVAYVVLMTFAEQGVDDAVPGGASDPAVAWPGPVFWIALVIFAVTGLITVIWWIADGIRMNRRLEHLDAQLRQELAREHSVDPWSF